MKNSLFDIDAPHPEASSLTAFSGNTLDRQSEYRDDDCLEQALKVEGTHILAFTGSRLILKHDGQVLDPLFAAYELADLQPDYDNAVLLGYRETGEPRIAVPVGVAAEDLDANFKPTEARALYRDGLLDEELLGEAAQGAALIHWNLNNRYCGKCGGLTESRAGGYRRVCTQCQNMTFPRTDPVAIMLVVDEERDCCLLGRSHHFQEGLFSCLAGFVEPGETIEHAVRREIFEESGIRTGRVRYHASQPWPMPHSLMIGCYAQATSTEITIDQQEIADCRWFSRDEVRHLLEGRPGEGLFAPPAGAIAYRLIRDWIDWP